MIASNHNLPQFAHLLSCIILYLFLFEMNMIVLYTQKHHTIKVKHKTAHVSSIVSGHCCGADHDPTPEFVLHFYRPQKPSSLSGPESCAQRLTVLSLSLRFFFSSASLFGVKSTIGLYFPFISFSSILYAWHHISYIMRCSS